MLFLQDDDLEEDDSDPEQSAASGFVVADGHLSDSEGFQDPEELDTELEGACYLNDNCTPSRGAGASSRCSSVHAQAFNCWMSCLLFAACGWKMKSLHHCSSTTASLGTRARQDTYWHAKKGCGVVKAVHLTKFGTLEQPDAAILLCVAADTSCQIPSAIETNPSSNAHQRPAGWSAMPLPAAGEVQSAAAARQASPAEHVLACPNMLKLRAAMERARAANKPLVICRLPGSMDEGAHPGCLVLPGAVLRAVEMQVGHH